MNFIKILARLLVLVTRIRGLYVPPPYLNITHPIYIGPSTNGIHPVCSGVPTNGTLPVYRGTPINDTHPVHSGVPVINITHPASPPRPDIVPRATYYFTPHRKWHRNLCGDSSFEKTAPSASISDCQELVMYMESDPGYFTARGPWDITMHQPLLSYGTCSFGIKPASEEDLLMYAWYVGNLDIVDLLRDSIGNFGKDGMVGAQGLMDCQLGESKMGVHWSIYYAYP